MLFHEQGEWKMRALNEVKSTGMSAVMTAIGTMVGYQIGKRGK